MSSGAPEFRRVPSRFATRRAESGFGLSEHEPVGPPRGTGVARCDDDQGTSEGRRAVHREWGRAAEDVRRFPEPPSPVKGDALDGFANQQTHKEDVKRLRLRQNPAKGGGHTPPAGQRFLPLTGRCWAPSVGHSNGAARAPRGGRADDARSYGGGRNGGGEGDAGGSLWGLTAAGGVAAGGHARLKQLRPPGGDPEGTNQDPDPT